jgi:hypothetical protein
MLELACTPRHICPRIRCTTLGKLDQGRYYRYIANSETDTAIPQGFYDNHCQTHDKAADILCMCVGRTTVPEMLQLLLPVPCAHVRLDPPSEEDVPR